MSVTIRPRGTIVIRSPLSLHPVRDREQIDAILQALGLERVEDLQAVSPGKLAAVIREMLRSGARSEVVIVKDEEIDMSGLAEDL
ncbi:hypothetical protein ANRL1_02865 [Anaerolineae bacterium]|nr:hypothetical protein ANRL1_02865 [Anaerolineae bacterium]